MVKSTDLNIGLVSAEKKKQPENCFQKYQFHFLLGAIFFCLLILFVAASSTFPSLKEHEFLLFPNETRSLGSHSGKWYSEVEMTVKTNRFHTWPSLYILDHNPGEKSDNFSSTMTDNYALPAEGHEIVSLRLTKDDRIHFEFGFDDLVHFGFFDEASTAKRFVDGSSPDPKHQLLLNETKGAKEDISIPETKEYYAVVRNSLSKVNEGWLAIVVKGQTYNLDQGEIASVSGQNETANFAFSKGTQYVFIRGPRADVAFSIPVAVIVRPRWSFYVPLYVLLFFMLLGLGALVILYMVKTREKKRRRRYRLTRGAEERGIVTSSMLRKQRRREKKHQLNNGFVLLDEQPAYNRDGHAVSGTLSGTDKHIIGASGESSSDYVSPVVGPPSGYDQETILGLPNEDRRLSGIIRATVDDNELSRPGQIQILSWKIPSLHNIVKTKRLKKVLRFFDPDILCLQDIRTRKIEWLEGQLRDHHVIYHCAHAESYAGSVIFSRLLPLSTSFDIGSKRGDKEGRVITVEFPTFYLVSVHAMSYGASAGSQLPEQVSGDREKFDVALTEHLSALRGKAEEQGKGLVVVGCFMAAPTYKDVFFRRERANISTCSEEERSRFKALLRTAELVDVYRLTHPKKIAFTYWKGETRDRNRGFRLDLTLASPNIASVATSSILKKVLGGHHCPVGLTFSISPEEWAPEKVLQTCQEIWAAEDENGVLLSDTDDEDSGLDYASEHEGDEDALNYATPSHHSPFTAEPNQPTVGVSQSSSASVRPPTPVTVLPRDEEENHEHEEGITNTTHADSSATIESLNFEEHATSSGTALDNHDEDDLSWLSEEGEESQLPVKPLLHSKKNHRGIRFEEVTEDDDGWMSSD
eukprot:GCRY01002447.1.p1 GENE.GCRY01002447.1~~GCRY01002447.1.p1  ORF type:complete len:866 (-),score=128.69 GCRY01002447.1:458-3055(-)